MKRVENKASKKDLYPSFHMYVESVSLSRASLVGTQIFPTTALVSQFFLKSLANPLQVDNS